MKKNKKIYIIIALVVGMVIGLSIGSFVSYYQYDYRWIIGKHYNEIIANYGEFDSGNAEFVKEEKRHDNFYYNRSNIICENAGTYEAWSLFESTIGEMDRRLYPHIIIEFNSDGYAKSVSKGYYDSRGY